MQRLFVSVVLAAALSGCAVVAPYERPYDAYPPVASLDYPYDPYAPYAVAPAYRAPIWIGPPVRFRFNLQFWKGRGGHPWHRHGFRPHRFGGWRR